MLSGFPFVPVLVIYRLLTAGLCLVLRVRPVAAWAITIASLFLVGLIGALPAMAVLFFTSALLAQSARHLPWR